MNKSENWLVHSNRRWSKTSEQKKKEQESRNWTNHKWSIKAMRSECWVERNFAYTKNREQSILDIGLCVLNRIACLLQATCYLLCCFCFCSFLVKIVKEPTWKRLRCKSNGNSSRSSKILEWFNHFYTRLVSNTCACFHLHFILLSLLISVSILMCSFISVAVSFSVWFRWLSVKLLINNVRTFGVLFC